MTSESNRRMQRDLPSGILLAAGSLLGIFAMSLHPTAHDVLGAGDGEGPLRVNVLVHGVALASLPVLFLGLLGLARRLEPSRLGTAALVAWAFGGVAVLGAAVASGFVATDLMRAYLESGTPSDAARDRLHELLGYTHSWNQGFTRVYVAGTSAALLLFSLAILRTGRLPRVLGAAGLLVGLGVALGAHFGLVHLDVHGFGLIVLAQSAWHVGVAVPLMRGVRPQSTRVQPG